MRGAVWLLLLLTVYPLIANRFHKEDWLTPSLEGIASGLVLLASLRGAICETTRMMKEYRASPLVEPAYAADLSELLCALPPFVSARWLHCGLL